MKTLATTFILFTLVGCMSDTTDTEEFTDDEAEFESEEMPLGSDNFSEPHPDNCYAAVYDLSVPDHPDVSVVLPGFCNPFYFETGRPPEKEFFSPQDEVINPPLILTLDPVEI